MCTQAPIQFKFYTFYSSTKRILTKVFTYQELFIDWQIVVFNKEGKQNVCETNLKIIKQSMTNSYNKLNPVFLVILLGCLKSAKWPRTLDSIRNWYSFVKYIDLLKEFN